MPEPEAVKVTFGCGPGMCDMDVAHSKDEGERIYIGGAEGYLKVYDPDDLERCVRELNLDIDDDGDDGLAVTALATSPDGGELAIGLRNGSVNLYDPVSLEFKSILTRFTAPVLGLDYGMGGSVIAACGEEPGIRILRRSKPGTSLVLKEHDGGVKSVAWEPHGDLLASAGFDGRIKVTKVDPAMDELLCEVLMSTQFFEKEAVASSGDGQDGFKHLGKVAWHPEGTSLSVTGDQDPLLLARETWERTHLVPLDPEHGHMGKITLSAFSPDGLHLATAALDGRVVVWNVKRREAVRIHVHPEMETWRNVKWFKGDDQKLALAGQSIGGGLCTMTNVVPPSSLVDQGDDIKGDSHEENNKRPSASKSNGRTAGSGSSSTVKRKGSSAAKDLLDEEAVEDDGGEDSDTDALEHGEEATEHDDVAAADVAEGLDDSAVPVPNGTEGGEGVDRDGDDVGRAAAELNGGAGDVMDLTDGNVLPQAVVETTPLQDPFQPSSTPLGDARRYLCWNRVGTIISVDEGTHNVVEIDFADKSAGRNQRFMDSWSFVMGTMSPTGAVFASVADDEEGDDFDKGDSARAGRGHSILYYTPLGRRTGGESWTKKMPKGESALGVATGRGWAAVGTDRQFLRVFSASGLQGEVIILPGPVVTMVGGGDLLAAVYHQGTPLGEIQNMGYLLLDVGGRREISRGSVCVSPSAELTWLGLSEEFMLVAMDSSGLLMGLTQSLGWQWSPLLDTMKVSKNSKDRFWPVGVVTGKLLAATLKGGEEHPAAYPRPVITSVPLSAVSALSLDGEGEEVMKFERTYPSMRARVRQRRFNLESGLAEDDEDSQPHELERELTSQEAQLDSMIVKRIQEACANGKAGRAMDLASLLSLEKSFQIAIKVANHHGLTQLAASMEDAMIAKFRREEADDEDMEGGFEDEGLPERGRPRISSQTALRTAGHPNGVSSRAPSRREVEELGPLERAKRMGLSSVPTRPPLSSTSVPSAGKRYGGDGASDDDSDVEDAAAGGSDRGDHGEGEHDLDANDDDSQDDPGDSDPNDAGISTSRGGGQVSKLSRNSDPGDDDEDEKSVANGGAFGNGFGASVRARENQQSEDEGDEFAAPPAPRNPFARGTGASSPPKRKRKDVLETMNDLRGSPSPVAKRPSLSLSSRLSSGGERRTKKRNDRNVL